MGTELKQGLKLGWVRVLLAPSLPGVLAAAPRQKYGLPCPACGPHGVMLCLCVLHKGTALSLRKLHLMWIKPVAQTVKRLPAMRETWVQSLGQEDPLEKEMATHSSTLAWKIPWMEEPSRLQSMGSQRVGHD